MTTVTESNLEEFNTLKNLEATVQRADSKLDLIAWKLDQFEKDTAEEVNNSESTKENQPADEQTVIKLLQGVNQVKEEYEHLRREINEVQQLQRQLTDSLRNQLKQVQGRFGTLRERLIANPHVAMAVCEACFSSKKGQPSELNKISQGNIFTSTESTPIISLTEPPTEMTSATDLSSINDSESEEIVTTVLSSPRKLSDSPSPSSIIKMIPSTPLTSTTATMMTSSTTVNILDDSSDDDDGGFKSRASFRL